jgi:hypothetical protein
MSSLSDHAVGEIEKSGFDGDRDASSLVAKTSFATRAGKSG